MAAMETRNMLEVIEEICGWLGKIDNTLRRIELEQENIKAKISYLGHIDWNAPLPKSLEDHWLAWCSNWDERT